jgi:hypothetical protein
MRETGAVERLAFSLLALLLGALAGYVDLMATSVQAPAGVLLLSAFLLGGLQPRCIWRWSTLLGLGIPAARLAGWALGRQALDDAELLPLVVMPVIFAFLAALGGALARWALDSALPREVS